jgi:hypothetical protein
MSAMLARVRCCSPLRWPLRDERVEALPPARHPLTSSARLRAVASRGVVSVVGVRAVCCVWGGVGRACTLT